MRGSIHTAGPRSASPENHSSESQKNFHPEQAIPCIFHSSLSGRDTQRSLHMNNPFSHEKNKNSYALRVNIHMAHSMDTAVMAAIRTQLSSAAPNVMSLRNIPCRMMIKCRNGFS